MTVPIIIPMPMPMPAPRVCIVISGQRYCQEDETTDKSRGEAIFGFVGAFLYLMFLAHLFIEKGRAKTALFGLVAPFLIWGLILVLR